MPQHGARDGRHRGLALQHQLHVLAFELGDLEITELPAQHFEDAQVLRLRARAELIEIARREIGGDHRGDAARFRPVRARLDLGRYRGNRQCVVIREHEFRAAR
jgi:hypothetical protein